MAMIMRHAWAMPSRWTFSIKPIKEFIEGYYHEGLQTLDPFYGSSPFPVTYHSDIVEGFQAHEFLSTIPTTAVGMVDLAFFDPPYSPRQVSEVYKSLGLTATMQDTQTARYKKLVRDLMDPFIRPGGIVLSFGWNAQGMGLSRGYKKLELLVVDHGGDHNATLCLAERKQ